MTPEPPTLFDWQARREAFERADAGAQAAAEHADREHEGWQEDAYKLFMQFASGCESFQTEEARLWAHEQGLPLPPDGRAWGAVTKRAMRSGLQRIGYAATKSPNCHGNPKSVWRLTQPASV